MPLGRHISILDISPSALRDGRRRHVVVKAYFDGSSDERQEVATTLGLVSATDAAWPRLERAWAGALDDLGIAEWHSSAEFAARTRSDFLAATTRLCDALLGCWDEMAFSASVTVIVPDYLQAIRGGLLLPSSAEAICVDHAVQFVVVPTDADFPMFLYFDQTEGFMHPIRSVWQHATRQRRQRKGFHWQVAQMLPLDSRGVLGLQMADLVAWSSNRYQRTTRDPNATDEDRNLAMWANLCAGTSLRHQSKVYDFDALTRYSDVYRQAMQGEPQ